MTALNKIDDAAVMILGGIAFLCGSNGSVPIIIGVNRKNIKQTAHFMLNPNKRFLITDCSMSKENMYKTMLIVERNTEYLRSELLKWASTRKKK